MSGMNKNAPANLAAAVAALCAGTSVVVTRLAVGEIGPIVLAFYRYVVAAACLVPLLPFVWPKVRLPVADIIKVALLGAVFFGFFPWAFMLAAEQCGNDQGLDRDRRYVDRASCRRRVLQSRAR